MSRSRRKTPLMGITTCRSEKQDKKIWHSRLRARERTALATDKDPPDIKEVSNPWRFGKDGRQWIDPKSRWMRK